MIFSKTLIVLAATLLPFTFAAPVEQAGAAPNPLLKIRNLEARDVIADNYIVVYHSDLVNATALDAAVASIDSIVTKRKVGGKKHRGVRAKYNLDGFRGYAIEADAATIGEIVAKPEVRNIITNL